MTFNIKNSADWNDKQSINCWTNRREKIVKIIEKYNPTVIGFQEVLIDQLDYLKKNLSNEYSFYGIGRNDGKALGEFNPILFKRTLMKPKKSGTFWLSETPSKPSKSWKGCCFRICSWVSFENPIPMIIANTHLDEKYQETRLKSLQVLRRELLLFNRPIILLGDFNFTRTSLEYQKLLIELQMKDGFKEGYKGNSIDRLITYHGYTGNISDSTKRFIDFIFISVDIFQALHAQVIHYNSGGEKSTYPSDHWPVLVEFNIKL